MANRWASLDPTWAHHPVPAPTHAAAAGHCCGYSSSPNWFSNPAAAAAFENEALTSALRASMSPAAGAGAASSASYPTTPSSSSTSSASELLSGGHEAPTAASRRPAPAPAPAASRALLARPAGGRVAKRKSRPSRRAQTTYISADPADFRRMVQEITGLPVAPGPSSSSACAASANAAAAPSWTAPPQAFVLPTLDTSAFLLDRAAAVAAAAAPVREDKGSCGRVAAPAMAVTAAAAVEEDEASAVLLELEAMAGAPGGGGFPTLESWGII